MSKTVGWTECKLGNVLTLKRGYDLPSACRIDGSFPIVSSSGITGWHKEAKVKAPGVVTGRYGTLGEVFYLSQDFWPLNTTLYVQDFHGNDPKYASYLLKTLNLASRSGAAAVPGLNRNDLHLLPVRNPPLPCQKNIAAILSAYDDLIENNERRIRILEDMAQNLYREWFIKFRFPGHSKVKMVDSPLGKIPQGWKVKPLSSLVETQYGYTESAKEEAVGPKYLRGMDINKTSYIDWSQVPYCPIDKEDHEKYRVRAGDIFVIRMADPGKVGIVEQDVTAVFASYLIRVGITSELITPYYLFHFLSSNAYQDYITGASTGTTRKSASAGVVVGTDIVVPNEKTLGRFENEVGQIRRLLTNLLRRTASLRQTRDHLLPKLISGEVDVSELDIRMPESAA